MISSRRNFHYYHTQTDILSTRTFRAGIYNHNCETRLYARAYMAPCRTRLFGHLFRISQRLSLRKFVALYKCVYLFIGDRNGRIYGLKPIHNVCKQVYAAAKPTYTLSVILKRMTNHILAWSSGNLVILEFSVQNHQPP